MMAHQKWTPPILQPVRVSAMQGARCDFRLLFAARCVRMLGFGAVAVVLLSLLDELGLAAVSGLLLSLVLAGDMVISFLLTTSADRVGRRRVLVIGSVLALLSSAVYSSSGSFLLLVVAGVIGVLSPAGGDVGPFLAVEQAALAQLMATDCGVAELAGTYGRYQAVGELAKAAGAVLAGSAVEAARGAGLSQRTALRMPLLLFGAAAVVKGVFYWLLSPRVEAEQAGAPQQQPVVALVGAHGTYIEVEMHSDGKGDDGGGSAAEQHRLTRSPCSTLTGALGLGRRKGSWSRIPDAGGHVHTPPPADDGSVNTGQGVAGHVLDEAGSEPGSAAPPEQPPTDAASRPRLCPALPPWRASLASLRPAPRLGLLHPDSQRVVTRLSVLFGLDAFAGGFAMLSYLAFWFHDRWGLDFAQLGGLLASVNVLAGLSGMLSGVIVARIGAVETMVLTHLPSNLLLMLVPLMPTPGAAVAMLMLRFSISQVRQRGTSGALLRHVRQHTSTHSHQLRCV
jgi:MFS family permease